RTNIVLTRAQGFMPAGAVVARSLTEALTVPVDDPAGNHERFILGGAEVFAQALPRCTRLYLTMVGNLYPADRHFPRAWGEGWTAVRSEAVPADDTHRDPHLFVLFERPRPDVEAHSGPSPLPIAQ